MHAASSHASVEADAIVDPVLMTQSSVGKARVREDDGMLALSFRLPKSRVIAIDETARRTGISRSLFLRTAVDCALMQGLYTQCLESEAIGLGVLLTNPNRYLIFGIASMPWPMCDAEPALTPFGP